MTDGGSHVYDSTLTGISFKSFRKNQNVGYFNCGKQSYLKRDCKQDIPRKDFLRDDPRRPL